MSWRICDPGGSEFAVCLGHEWDTDPSAFIRPSQHRTSRMGAGYPEDQSCRAKPVHPGRKKMNIYHRINTQGKRIHFKVLNFQEIN